MQMRVLTTNHGKHKDSKLADAAAADLVENAANMSGQDALEMRRLENSIADILEGHFKDIAERENDCLKTKGHEHLASSLEAHPQTAAAIEDAVLDLYVKSPFAFDGEIARKNVHEVVTKWVKVAQHMHRDWFAGSGKLGHGAALTDYPGFDPKNEHVVRWFDLHSPKTPEHFRRALHEHATGEKLPQL
jgi:hypothetical protein